MLIKYIIYFERMYSLVYVCVQIWFFFLKDSVYIKLDFLIIVDLFLQEIDVDAVAVDGEVICMVVLEYVENVGVYLGDVILVILFQDLNEEILVKIRVICCVIGRVLEVIGLFNLQFIVKVIVFWVFCGLFMEIGMNIFVEYMLYMNLFKIDFDL